MHSSPDQQPSAEEQIALLKQQLAQAQKLTALGELVGTTTHEFNNVLMTILNYAKLGLRHKDTATRDKALDKILTAANRAANITISTLSTSPRIIPRATCRTRSGWRVATCCAHIPHLCRCGAWSGWGRRCA